MDRYLFEANIRVDGSSRFLNDKWGTFPSFSAGWVVSRENFFQNVAAIDFLKIRASWGQLGNQNTEDIAGNFPFSRSLSLSQAYSFGGNVVPGVSQTSLGNSDLGWETATLTDIGIDIGIFDNLTIEADYFVRRTEDILFNLPISTLTGFTTQIANASTVENKGWELAINYDKTFGDVNFSVSGNVTNVKTEVVELNPNIDIGELDQVINGVRLLERGQPMNAFYVVRNVGIFQSQAEIDAAPDHSALHPLFGPGDLRFDDLNGDGVIDQDDRTVVGKEDPTWIYGMTLRANYKGFDIAALFQGAADFHGFGSAEIARPLFNGAGLWSGWYDRWTPENTDAAWPRLFNTNGPSTSIDNSFFIFDRSYFRFKNLQIGYTLTPALLDKTFLTAARVYVNGTNLFTITDFPYFDPERPVGADRGGQGYPNIKAYTVGVSLSF